LKKIILFSHEYPPCLGGVGTIAEQVKNYFENNDKYEVKVITSSRSLKYKTHNLLCSFFPSQCWPFSYYLEYRKEFLASDLIICNDPAAIYTAGMFFSEEILSKTICCIHGEEKYLTSTKLLLRLIAFKKSFLKAINYSAKVIFVSSYIQEYYATHYGIYTAERKGVVINPGVYSETVIVRPTIKKKNRFITVCRLHKDKGFIHMLKVFEYMDKMGLEFEWIIVGGGAYFDELSQLIDSSYIKPYVSLTGSVERTDLSHYYSSSEFCILLSELNESYGLSYLEAAHFGVKPIGYNRCGVRDVFNYITKGLLLYNYKDIEENAKDILSFVNKKNNGNATSCRFASDFSKDLELLLVDVLNGVN
jgi:glycosyltransferase involved in cell wall biosynthesis